MILELVSNWHTMLKVIGLEFFRTDPTNNLAGNLYGKSDDRVFIKGIVALVNLELHQELLCTVQLNWTQPEIFIRHFRKTWSRTLSSCALTSSRDILKHLCKKSIPTKCQWKAAKRWFLLVLQSLGLNLQNSNSKSLDFVFF